MAPVTPKSLVLDLLRVAPGPVPVRHLVAVGELFGLEGTAVRVALTRLVRRRLLESDERGTYRLAPASAALARWVDAWRLGERRTRPWRGDWLCVWQPRGGARGARRASQRALARYGFREGLPGLFVRPDNLSASAMEADLRDLGLAPAAVLFAGRAFPAPIERSFRRSLWALAALRGEWRRAARELERSRARLGQLAREQALCESFLLGGRAIRLLARDPLLPAEIVDGAERARLHAAMLAYDRAGKAIWTEFLEAPGLDAAPGHLALAS